MPFSDVTEINFLSPEDIFESPLLMICKSLFSIAEELYHLIKQ